MGLLKRPEVSKTLCITGQAFVGLDPDDVALIGELVDDGRPYTVIARVLTDGGLKMSPSSVRNHMGGVCPCDDSVPFFAVRGMH